MYDNSRKSKWGLKYTWLTLNSGIKRPTFRHYCLLQGVSIHGKAPTSSPILTVFKPCNLKTMGTPDFSKNWTIVLNFHAKIINTLIPVCQQTTKKWYVKRSCSTNYIFNTAWFSDLFWYKKMLTCNWWLQ